MKTKAFLALCLMFCILLPAPAQTRPATPAQPQQPNETKSDDKDEVVRITTNLVQVDAVVTKDGKPVSNLTAEDFEIFEDGRRQTITSFAYISNVPTAALQPATVAKKTPDGAPYMALKPDETRRTMAIVVDDLGISAESMGQVRKQLRKFVAEQLQPNDLVAILRTGGEMGALQQFTNDKRLLNRAVDQLRWNMCNRVGINVLSPVGSFFLGPNLCGRFSMSATLKSLRFIVESMGYLPGRKSLVFLSDSLPREDQDEFLQDQRLPKGEGSGTDDRAMGGPGTITVQEDQSSRGLETIKGVDSINYSSALQKIAEKAIRSSVVIYSVDTQGLQVLGPTAADDFHGNGPQLQALLSSRSLMLQMRREGGELIAKQTGGFQIRNSNGYGLNRILEDQSGYYLLGYRPSEETFNRRFHHIKAKVKRSGMTLRTRFGFFGVTEEEATRARPSARDLTNLALASPFAAQDINVDLTSFFASDNVNGLMVRSFIYIDTKDLAFSRVDERQQASIELHGVVFGDNGAIIEQARRGLTLHLSKSDYQQAMNYGMAVSFDIPVKRPGSYQVRVATRDRTSSRVGSAGQFVVVPDLRNKRMAVSGIVLGTGNADRSMTSPGARRFHANSELNFAYMIYNAMNETGQPRNLAMQARLFRDDRVVYSGSEVPIVAANQPDPNRVFAEGAVRLAPDLESGNYYLQIVITETDAKNKATSLVQWTNFEIEKP